MAELDIKGFVTPEQEFPGLYKLGDTLAAQKAAKAKAEQEEKTNRAALAKYAEGVFNIKDYLSGTVADPNITKKTSDALEKVYSFIDQNKGATQSQIQLVASPLVRSIADYSEKSKELKRQMDAFLDHAKTIPGIDVTKARNAFINRAWGIQEGQVPEDLSNVDITHDYTSDVLNNDNIYNSQAITEALKPVKSVDYQYSTKTRDKRGVERASMYDVKSQPFYQPIVDASGRPTGEFEPKHQIFTDGNQVVMHDWLGDTGEKTKEPIKLLDKIAFNHLLNNPTSAAYLRQEVNKITQGKAPLNSSQSEHLARAIAYNMVKENMTEPASIKLKEEQKQPLPPRVSVSVGGGGAGAETRDLHTPAKRIYDDMQSLKDRAVDLFNNGRSLNQVAQALGLDPVKSKSFLESSQQGTGKYTMPLNTKGLNADFVNNIVRIVNEGGGVGSEEDVLGGTKTKKYDRGSLSIQLNEDGDWEVFPVIDNKMGDLIATVSPTSLNYKVQAGAPEKRILSAQEKGRTKAKTYKLSSGKSYTHQQLLDMGYTEQNIQDAIKAGNLK